MAVEAQLEKYRKGRAFADMRARRAMRALGIEGQNKEALVASIRSVAGHRRAFLLGQLKDLDAMSKLRESLDHHIREVKKRREEIRARARVRVPGCVYKRVTVQIGQVYKEIDEDTRGVAYRLNKKGDAIAQERIGG